MRKIYQSEGLNHESRGRETTDDHFNTATFTVPGLLNIKKKKTFKCDSLMNNSLKQRGVLLEIFVLCAYIL